LFPGFLRLYVDDIFNKAVKGTRVFLSLRQTTQGVTDGNSKLERGNFLVFTVDMIEDPLAWCGKNTQSAYPVFVFTVRPAEGR